MIDDEGMSFFFGGDGLNSSRNFDFFVLATLLFRAICDGSVEGPVMAE
jgi:hypothetical protein